LRRGIPVAKIIGRKWFYGLEFETGRHTLDPRPDSETLVEAVLEYTVSFRGLPQCGKPRNDTTILDLGTGTGNLICALIKNIPNASGIGIDRSFRAVCVARRNVKRLGLSDRIEIFKENFNSVGKGIRHKTYGINGKRYALCPMPYAFDIIVSNPPYIAIGDPRVDMGARHDPATALYAGSDGLGAYRAIAANARKLLKPSSRIFLEIGAGQGDAVRNIFRANGWQFIAAKKDLGGIERVLVFRNNE